LKKFGQMENSIYLALSRQMTLQTNMDIVANNVANMNTNGFRAQNIAFEEYISDPGHGDDPLSFSYDYGEYQNTAPGSQQQTGNPYNVALNGPGFMGIQSPTGETVYTRDGNFQRAADGKLVTSAGYPVMGQGGAITIPDNSIEINIDQRGVVSNQDGELGQLMVVEFDNVQMLEAMGNNVYHSPDAGTPSIKTTVAQGFLEGSNVKPVVEITRMIEILRNFQSTQRILQTEHDRLRSAIQALTQA